MACSSVWLRSALAVNYGLYQLAAVVGPGLGGLMIAWLGVGASRRLSAVRWNVASSIVVAWVVTIPAAAIVGALFYWVTTLV